MVLSKTQHFVCIIIFNVTHIFKILGLRYHDFFVVRIGECNNENVITEVTFVCIKFIVIIISPMKKHMTRFYVMLL